MADLEAMAFLREALDRAQADAEYSRDQSMYFDCGDQAVADHYQRAGSPETVLAQVAADRELIDECDTVLTGWYYGETKELAHQVLLLRAKAWGWKDEQS